MCASGRWVAVFAFELKEPANYDYPTRFFSTSEECSAFLASYVNFNAPDGYHGAYGEWYNYVVRALAFDKVLDADWAAWVASH